MTWNFLFLSKKAFLKGNASIIFNNLPKLNLHFYDGSDNII